MTAIILGDVEFSGFEIPESIPLGGRQSGTMHKIPGGVRVFDAMGPDDEPISWHGLFRGASAIDRATALDGMRRAGNQHQLSILGLSYLVVIEAFTYTIRRPYEVDYSITLEVIEDQTQGLDDGTELPIDTVVGDDIAAGTSALGESSGAILAALTTFSAALGAVSSIRSASVTNLAPARAAAYALTAAMDSEVDDLDATISSDPIGASPLDTGVSGLLAASEALSTAATVHSARAYLGRSAVNVVNSGW